MRSSVSYILSSSTTEPNMSHPDYEQFSHDHAALLVLVKNVGFELKLKNYNKCHDRVAKINFIKVTDSTGQTRIIYIRYVKEYPPENNEWGDFQTHRRLLGLISIGKYETQTEFNEVCRIHETLKVKYGNTLFDSRCILFGPVKTDDADKRETDADAAPVEVVKFEPPTNFKTRALIYADNDPCNDLEVQITEFINSLFWVLESKRLERSREKLERVQLLYAPFEKKDFVGLDMESRNNRRRCTGRVTKHLGDICLQAGLISESLGYYASAVETLKNINDWLWLGAAYEGLCTATALVLYPNMQRSVVLQRNASLQEGSPRRSSTVSLLLTGDTELLPRKSLPYMLPSEDILKRYREAIIHYSKYQSAGIVETEASFKAARIAIAQGLVLQAASFLQNVVYINLTLSEQEKIQRFEMLAELYTQIGFTRKAAFCLRLAATRYVSPQNPSPNWQQCYTLMLQSLEGHRLSLDPAEAAQGGGWPALQVQLLQELVVAAKRTGNSALATRHMTFLLQVLWDHLGQREHRELAVQLQGLAAQCEGAPVPLVLESGTVIPPANLVHVPRCLAFVPRALPPHLRPRPVAPPKEDQGPFLFTPIHFGSMERQPKSKSKMDFLWVAEQVCEVQVTLQNPLGLEVRVGDMRLLSSGTVLEALPETTVLPPDATTRVTLVGVPHEAGYLRLTGYSTHALGIKSNCRLRQMSGVGLDLAPEYSVEVVPALPVIQVSTPHPEASAFCSLLNTDIVVSSAALSLHQGESQQLKITLTNSSSVTVEQINLTAETCSPEWTLEWDAVALASSLPLLPGEVAELPVTVRVDGLFLNSSEAPVGSANSGPSSLPSHLNSLQSSGIFMAGKSEFNSSFRSSASGDSRSYPVRSLETDIAAYTRVRQLEGLLRIWYSGGTGLAAGHGRALALHVALEALPSLRITGWDALPADEPHLCYLVLDVLNLATREMELSYAQDKAIVVQAGESCRVPVSVPRCPLSKLTAFYDDVEGTGPAEASRIVEMGRVCAEHLVQSVDLRWRFPGTENEAHGIAHLRGLYLEPSMLDIVRMLPVQWEVLINGDAVKGQEEVACTVGECMQLAVAVTNSLARPLRQLTVSVRFYQDYANGTVNYRLESRVVIAGANRLLVTELEPNAKDKYECRAIFLSSGLYKADIRCVTGNASAWRFIPTLTVSVT